MTPVDAIERGRLVLSRKAGQSIEVGGATISVVRIKGDGVRLMIEAPKSVPVVRSEVARD